MAQGCEPGVGKDTSTESVDVKATRKHPSTRRVEGGPPATGRTPAGSGRPRGGGTHHGQAGEETEPGTALAGRGQRGDSLHGSETGLIGLRILEELLIAGRLHLIRNHIALFSFGQLDSSKVGTGHALSVHTHRLASTQRPLIRQVQWCDHIQHGSREDARTRGR